MQIVITDGYTLNPGDLSWEKFKKFGNITYFDRTQPNEIVSRCAAADIIIVNKTIVTKETIGLLPNLKLIAVTATGFNCIDIAAAKLRDIPVCNVPVYGTYSVAQHTIALLLELSNRAGFYSESINKGEWSSSDDWCYTKWPVNELFGKTLGIVGYGRIGRQTAKIAKALGMKIIYNTAHQRPGDPKYKSLSWLFSESDYITLHCPLTTSNEAFINRSLIGLMKSTACLINTSRGQLINEPDLADALKNNRIRGAALDVLAVEPPPYDHPLFGLNNCIITPHNAWKSLEARERIMDTTLKNIKSILAKRPKNVVNL